MLSPDLPRSPDLMDERVRDSVMESILSVTIQWHFNGTSMTLQCPLHRHGWMKSHLLLSGQMAAWPQLLAFSHGGISAIDPLICFCLGEKFLSLFKFMTKKVLRRYGILWQFVSWSWTCISPSKAQNLQRAPKRSSRKQQNGCTTSYVMLLFFNIKKRFSSLITIFLSE